MTTTSTTTFPAPTARRTLMALCAAGLFTAAPALADDLSDVETAPGTPGFAQQMTAMADPSAAMPAETPAATPAPAPAMAAPPAPEAHAPRGAAFSQAVAAALNDYYHGDYAGAADRLNAAASADPADPAAPYFLGYTYYRLGDFAKSRAAFAQAYQVDPHFSPEPPASK
jgi:tetratricopeptide (TPR) repeat protein